MNEPLTPGARVSWRGLNRDYSGEVVAITPRGALVRLEGGDKCIILSTINRREKDAAR